ncbi:DUF5677 domain-containing protein [Xanthomonas sp. 10-10]|uniref:DUF5677 domain-containing protein n=1 Tax=Xanthomonas sp. 10-10 TaxID=3115848 RepID=A0AAU7P6T8_9XANT
MSKRKQIFKLSNRQLEAAVDMAGCMRPPLVAPGRPQCAIFLTMIEQFEAALRLAEVGLATHGASHARAMLESLATFRLLGHKPEQITQMQYEQLRGEKKLYETVLQFPELVGEERKHIELRLENCLVTYRDLHARNVRPSKLIENFEAAGIAALAAPYTMLCSFAHNDLAALALRHQGEAGMTLRAGDSDDVVFLVMSIVSYALLDSVAGIGKIALFPDGRFEQHYSVMGDAYIAMMKLR